MFWTELPEFNLNLISSLIKFLFFTVVPKYLNCATFSKDLHPLILPCSLVTRQQIYLVFSVFTSRPTSILGPIKVSVIFFMVRVSVVS
jgi:hypothetical protein